MPISEYLETTEGSAVAAAVPSALKHKNRQLVLDCFRDHQEHSVADVVARTGISKLTVMRAIQFFCGKGILASSGKGESTEQGGKKPEFFRFALRKYLLNITLWPETLGITLFDMNLQEIKRSSFDWIIPTSSQAAFDFIKERSLDVMEQAGVGCADLYGVSLSTSGIVDYDKLILKYSVHSPEWGSNIPVGEYLRNIFGDVPCIFIENAGKSISRAVVDDRKLTDQRALVLFTSWGLSGAMIQDGKILNGRDSLIGEIGHMRLDPYDPEQCICGSYGCAERLVSVARLRKYLASDPPPVDSPLAKYTPESVNLRHLFSASQQGDEYAREYVAYLADSFAALLRNVSLTFNPETVVFVGDYSLADKHFDNQMRLHFNQFHYLASSKPMQILYDTRSLPDLDARGGAIALLNNFFAQSKLYEDEE